MEDLMVHLQTVQALLGVLRGVLLERAQFSVDGDI
jgi:hypothetical protein